ncbi:MAG: hypothetical protein ACOC44_09085 [Promethearchaeia archaeon]
MSKIYQSELFRKTLSLVLRVLVFLATALTVVIRILTIIPIIVGIIFIWKDSKKYGQFLGWLLAIGGLLAVILFDIMYSIEGGLVY